MPAQVEGGPMMHTPLVFVVIGMLVLAISIELALILAPMMADQEMEDE